MPGLPLAGVRVLDMTVVWAGTYCATLLADLGAEVIRVESTRHPAPLTRGAMAHPTEELVKDSPPMFGGMPGRVPGRRPWNRFPVFNAHGRNKLSMTVDLLKSSGKEIFNSLVRISDVFVENNVTETMDKLGISYEGLRELRADIVTLRMPAYGSTGRYRNFRSLGIHMEGTVGHSLLRGYADMDPSANTQVYVADAAAGAQGAFAVLTALHHRRRTGEGQLIELAQAENVAPFLGQFFLDYSMNSRSGSTIGNRHPYAIQGCYPCKGEDCWVAITIFDDADWAAFRAAIGSPEWAEDPRFDTQHGRYQAHDELDTRITEWTSERGHYEAMNTLQQAGVAAGAVMDQADAYSDPHLAERGAFEEAYQEDVGTHLYPGAPYKMSRTPLRIRRGPVRLGEDNEYVYKQLLNIPNERYAELEREGHIGMDYE